MKMWRTSVALVLTVSMMFIGTRQVWAARVSGVQIARMAATPAADSQSAPAGDPEMAVAGESAVADGSAIEAPEENPYVVIMLIFGVYVLSQSLDDLFQEVFEVGSWTGGFMFACVEVESYLIQLQEQQLADQILDVLQQDPIYGQYGVNQGITDGGGSLTVNTDTFQTFNLSLYFDGVPDSDFTGQEGGACWNDNNCTDPPEDMILYCDNGGPDTLGTCVATLPHYCC